MSGKYPNLALVPFTMRSYILHNITANPWVFQVPLNTHMPPVLGQLYITIIKIFGQLNDV